MKFRPKFRSKLALAAVAAAAAVAIAIPAVAVADAGTTAGTSGSAAAALVGYADPGQSIVTSSSAPASTAGNGAVAAAPNEKPAHAKLAKVRHDRLPWLRDHRLALANVAHAQWTVKSKDGSFVTHDVIHGDVAAAAAGATGGTVTVTAADKSSQTYTTSSTTKVWKVIETNGKRRIENATLADVTSGSEVIVEGTGTNSPYAAAHIRVQLKK